MRRPRFEDPAHNAGVLVESRGAERLESLSGAFPFTGSRMLFFLIAGHALMDFALQSDAMAVCKCRRTDNPIQKSVPWYYWLTAHALLHGAAVGIILHWTTNNWDLALGFAIAETVVHWCIDLGKCERWYSIHVDQGLHIACKILWWGLIVSDALKVAA